MSYFIVGEDGSCVIYMGKVGYFFHEQVSWSSFFGQEINNP